MSALFLALGLAAGEMALATAAYLAAYAVFIDEAPWHRRLMAMIPNVLVLVAWAAIYKLGRFGARGSGFYLDPASEPLAFARALGDRALYLLVGQWTPLAADLGSLYESGSDEALRFRFAAIAFLALLTLLLLPLLRSDKLARFWCAGSLLSILPIAATGPQNRLLFFVGLGSMALLAQVGGRFDPFRAGPRGAPIRRLAAVLFTGLLFFFHLVLSPLTTPWNAGADRRLGQRMMAAIATIPGDPRIAEQDLVLVNAPEHVYFVTAIPVVKPLQGQAFPRRLRALANGKSAMRATRVDERTLDLELESGLFPDPFSHYFRGESAPLTAGHQVVLSGFTAQVLKRGAGGDPVAIRYRFERPLEDPSLRWVRWEEQGYAQWPPPAIGATITLPATGDPLFD